MEPADAAVAEPCAWWVADHKQIPAVIKEIAHIAHHVAITAILGGQKVTGPNIVAQRGEGRAHDARGFAADQNAHWCKGFLIGKHAVSPG